MNKTEMRKRTSIINRLLKDNKKTELGEGYMALADGKYWFCSPYRMLVVNDKMDFAEAPCNIDIANVIFNKEESNHEITIDIEGLKTFIKESGTKPSKVVPYVVENEHIKTYTKHTNIKATKIGFNPKWLLDLLTFYKTDKICVSGYACSPCYVNGDDGEYGMLLPIRIKQD